MRAYALTHLSDHDLLRRLTEAARNERTSTAELLAHLAETDARRLYAPAGFPSMYEYCVRVLGLSEDAAFRRIRAARTARRFPALFGAIADGRLHLSGLLQLAPYLTSGNATELLEAAAGRNKAAIAEFLAGRFPRSEMLTWVEDLEVQAVAGPSAGCGSSTGHGSSSDVGAPIQLAPAPAGMTGQEPTATGHSRCSSIPRTVPPVTATASGRYVLQVGMGKSLRDKLRYAQQLAAHQNPSGDVAQILERALDVLIERLEKRKFAPTTRPRVSARPSHAARTIPAHVRRAG